MLSGRYPFFRAQDDMGYLAQIISLLGTDSCLQAADSIGLYILNFTLEKMGYSSMSRIYFGLILSRIQNTVFMSRY